MSKLTEESLDFAKKHIESYYDLTSFQRGLNMTQFGTAGMM